MLLVAKMTVMETSRVDKAFQRASVWCEGVKTIGLNAFRSCFLKAMCEYGSRALPLQGAACDGTL